MKKVSIVILSILVIFSISTVSLAMSMDMSLDKTKDIKKNDTVIYTLALSEKIIGASFKIDYDKEALELVGSGTTNLSATNNNGKIACVYFDMAKTGIDTCSIKFKARKNIENTKLTFELEEAKFITLNGEKSYSQSDIAGIKKTITIEKSNSGNGGSTTNTPSSGNGNGDNVNDNSNNTSNDDNKKDDLNNSNNTNNSNNSSNANDDTNNSNNSNNAGNNTNSSNNSSNTSGNTNNSNNFTNTNHANNLNNTNSNASNSGDKLSENNYSKSDTTLANSILPKTGLNHYIAISICLVSILAVYFFIKMKSQRR